MGSHSSRRRRLRGRQSIGGRMNLMVAEAERLQGVAEMNRSTSAEFEKKYARELEEVNSAEVGSAAQAGLPLVYSPGREAQKAAEEGRRRRGSSGVDSIDSSISGLADNPAFAKEVRESLARSTYLDKYVSDSDDEEMEMDLKDATARNESTHGSVSSINKSVTKRSGEALKDWTAPPRQSSQNDIQTDDVLDALQGLIFDMQAPNPSRVRRGSDSTSREEGSAYGGGRSRRKSMFPRELSAPAPPIPEVVGTSPNLAPVKAAPQTLDDVTVLFSDVVGFTSLCSKLNVEEVGDLIGRLFTEFDRLAERHGVTKIDVIGDAYFGLCGIPDREGHAARAAMFSLEAIRASNNIPASVAKPELGNISVRFGLASGSVVATMVGSGSHLKYTLFGDVVNTASRMESTSIPNRVQCTKETADLIKEQGPAIEVELRGGTEVKGKGTLETFFVNPPKEGLGWGENGEGFII
mmetsp:Transcript_59004/g.175441  ORF Transcript_59004/g.175441 Transcript_59004/m.175441 type:complete len:466 (-) Transcript_59004:113-1510(-)